MKKYWFIFLVCLSFKANTQTIDSLDIKIGQMILIGMPKAEVDSAVLQEVKQGQIGSIIYFEDNVPKSSSAFAAFKKMSWTYQRAARIPLFICIDQEGGKVNRLKEKYGFSRSISADAIGKSKSIDSVRFYSEATASTLAGLGINVNFAPCVDLAVNPSNPVIAKLGRAYSANEDTVILFAKEVVKLHRKYGIVTVVKHFPGHGSSLGDTHLGLVDVTNTWSSRELKPYQSMIDSGYIDGVMSSHIVNKNLDQRSLPGTLSKAIIDSLLRKKLNYQGVVFSDAMEMKAIASNYGTEDAIRLALNAGIDILCFAHNISSLDEPTGRWVHRTIKKFVVSGVIPKSRIDESYKRIMKLKKKLGPDWEIQSLKIQNQKLAQLNIEKTAALNKANEELQQLKSSTKKSKKKKSKQKN